MTRGDRKVERDGPERDDDVPAPGGDAPNTQPPQWRGRRCSRPAIADVAQDPRAIGERAVQVLVDAMDDPGNEARGEILVPTTLIIRPSGEIRPA